MRLGHALGCGRGGLPGDRRQAIAGRPSGQDRQMIRWSAPCSWPVRPEFRTAIASSRSSAS